MSEAAWRWTAAGGGAALASSLLLMSVLWWRARATLRELQREVTALTTGRRPVRPLGQRPGGLPRPMAERFNAMLADLETRIARIRDDRQQLDAMLNGMSEGVLGVDARQRLVFANPAAHQLFQIGPDAVGKLIAELIRNPQIRVAVEATLSGAGAYRSEVTIAGEDPRTTEFDRLLSVHGTPLPGAPPPGAVLVIHDVTDLRRLERMRQDFVANASHELKTPLASIKANAETLLDWGLADDTVNVTLLRQIDEQADRLDRLVRDMLSLARLDSGESPFRHEPRRLGPLVRDCVEALEPRIRARGLDLAVQLEPLRGDVSVRAAEEAIRQILNNLLDNAIKYTPAGGSIRLAARVDAESVAVEVADTGVGIPRNDIPRIFERFYRVDKARSRDQGGTGLGLSIVKHLVHSLGGDIAVESYVGAGTTFVVTLPRHDPPHRRP